jgi:hypothetical protein
MNRNLFSRVAAAAAMLGLVLSIIPVAVDSQSDPRPIYPTQIELRFQNRSDRCALLKPFWKDADSLNKYTIFPKWPQFVGPGHEIVAGYGLMPPPHLWTRIALKVVVEITRDADCTGGTQKDLEVEYKMPVPTYSVTATFKLSGSSPSFSLSQTR